MRRTEIRDNLASSGVAISNPLRKGEETLSQSKEGKRRKVGEEMSPDLVRNFEIEAKICKLLCGLIASACAGSGPTWLFATTGCSVEMRASIKTGGCRYFSLINKEINRVGFESREWL